jgi:hypothetical protein
MKVLVLIAALAGSASAEPITFGVNLGFDARAISPGTDDSHTNQGASLDVEVGASLTPRLELTGFARLHETWIGDTDGFGTDRDELWLGGRFHALVSRSMFVGAGAAWVAATRKHYDSWSGMALEVHVGTRIPAGRIAIEPLIEIGRIDLNGGADVIYLRGAIGLRW